MRSFRRKPSFVSRSSKIHPEIIDHKDIFENPTKPAATPEDSSNLHIDTSHTKWTRGGAPVMEKVLNEYRGDLTPSQLSSLESTLAQLNEQQPPKSPNSNSHSTNTASSTASPLLRKPRGSPKPQTKSTRFLSKLSVNVARSKNGESGQKAPTFIQHINLHEIEICQQIGRGASSAGVYLCIVDGWACAMKQLKREYVCAMDIRCFEREMDILYQLPPHPHIVRYLFHTAQGSDLCLFMQLYSGTLREYLDHCRASDQWLPPEFVTKIALEAAMGIQFLHQHGVIHRDIKAGNIFVTKNENDEVIRVAIGDFDTSVRVSASLKNVKAGAQDKVFQDTGSASNQGSSALGTNPRATRKDEARMNTAEKRNYFAQNRPRSTVGTAGFMAPEVLRSKNSTPYGFKVDIYSFGMLLYEMITLRLPFEQLDTADIITAVLEGKVVDSMQLQQQEDVRKHYAGLVDLYQQCTNLNPDERPSLDEIIQRLTTMVSGEEIRMAVERKPSLVEQLNKYNPDSPVTFENPEANGATGKSKLKFRGPQTQRNSDRRFPVPLGMAQDRDIIVRGDNSSESESEEETMLEGSPPNGSYLSGNSNSNSNTGTSSGKDSSHPSRLQRSVSTFRAFGNRLKDEKKVEKKSSIKLKSAKLGGVRKKSKNEDSEDFREEEDDANHQFPVMETVATETRFVPMVPPRAVKQPKQHPIIAKSSDSVGGDY